MHAMTAAHTTLPLPTWVEVTNLVNGKRVVVKVNDRGPFVDNRLIDLSYAAATALDMVGTGTTRVEVRTVAPPVDAFRAGSTVAAAAPAAPQAQGAVAAERMFLQIGAFADAENAERLAARLRASGFANPTVVTRAERGAPDAPRVVGPRSRLGRVRRDRHAPALDRHGGGAARRGHRAMSSYARSRRAVCLALALLVAAQLEAQELVTVPTAADCAGRAAEARRQEPLPRRLHDGQGPLRERRRRGASAGEPHEAHDGLRRVRRFAVRPHSARRPRARQRAGVAHGRHAHVHRRRLRGRHRGSAARPLDPIRQRCGRRARGARLGIRGRVRRRDERRRERARHAAFRVSQSARAAGARPLHDGARSRRARERDHRRVSRLLQPLRRARSSATTASPRTTATRSCGATRASTA